MFGWLKRWVVKREANKSRFLRGFLDWLVKPGNRRAVAAGFFALAEGLKHSGYMALADKFDELHVVVETIPWGIEGGAFVLILWSIFDAKKKAKEEVQ